MLVFTVFEVRTEVAGDLIKCRRNVVGKTLKDQLLHFV